MIICYSNQRELTGSLRVTERVGVTFSHTKESKGVSQRVMWGRAFRWWEQQKKSLRLLRHTLKDPEATQRHTAGHTGLANTDTKPQPPTRIRKTLAHMDRQKIATNPKLLSLKRTQPSFHGSGGASHGQPQPSCWKERLQPATPSPNPPRYPECKKLRTEEDFKLSAFPRIGVRRTKEGG